MPDSHFKAMEYGEKLSIVTRASDSEGGFGGVVEVEDKHGSR